MTELNKLEREAYKMNKKRMPKTNPYKEINKARRGPMTNETKFGSKFAQWEHEYYTIYRDYFYNLILNLITYENAPITLDTKFLEYLLRNYGYARVAGVDPNNIYVVDYENKGVATPSLGAIGWNHDTETNESIKKLDGSGERLRQILRTNVFDIASSAQEGYILISNKYNGYLGQLTNYTDFGLIDRVCKTLALIKATQLMNITQQRTPFIGYSRKKNLTAKNVYENFIEGVPFIEIDEDLGDLTNVFGVAPIQAPNYLPQLKAQFNNEFDELLTMIGINALGIDKKERLVSNEANSNAQLTEASANIYLDARNSQLELLNTVLGTNIYARLNQESAKQLVMLRDQALTLGSQVGIQDSDVEASPQSI